VAEDFAETKNLAETERDANGTLRERLIAMIGMWYVEAGKYNVLPIDSRTTLRIPVERPQIAVDRQRYVYYPGTQAIPINSAPRLMNRPHSISVDATVPDAGAEGALLSMGGMDGGFVFYVHNGKLTYGYNYVADTYFRIESSHPLPSGRHISAFNSTRPAPLTWQTVRAHLPTLRYWSMANPLAKVISPSPFPSRSV
jgi:hypothetical protein